MNYLLEFSVLLLVLAVQVAIMVQASQFTYARFQAGVIASKDGLTRLEEVVDDRTARYWPASTQVSSPSKVAASTSSPSR